MSTVGTIFGALSQKDMLKHQARIAEINAQIVDSNARNTIRVGTIEESRVKLATAQAKSQQVAQMTASGVDIAGSNTALARLTGTDMIGEVDANTVRSNALRAAWGQRIEAGNLRRGAAALRAEAKGISPFMAGMTSLIEGAGQVAASWYSLNKQGAFASKTPAPAAGKATVGTDNLQRSDGSGLGWPTTGGRPRFPWESGRGWGI